MKRDNLNRINHLLDDVTIIEFDDGSNLIITTKDGLIEVATYTANVKGYYREQPVIHMVNSNTLKLELRRKEMKGE